MTTTATARPRVLDRPTSLRVTLADRTIWLTLGVVAAVVYAIWTGPQPQQIDAFGPLAHAFLNGRLYIELPAPGALELIARDGGGWYVPYPPGPAIPLLPVIAITNFLGATLDIGLAAAGLGGVGVALLYVALRSLNVAARTAAILTVGFAFGSVWWWAAGEGDVWLYAHVNAVVFMLGALILALRGGWPLVSGLLFGVALASRLPVGLTFPLFLALHSGARWTSLTDLQGSLRAIRWRPILAFSAGVIAVGIGLALYNFARFGSFFDFGYTRIPGIPEDQFFGVGVLSLDYIPRHFYAMFLRSFDYVDQFPWFRPNWMGLSLLITTPIFLWLVRARSRTTLVAIGWIAVALALLPIVTHGTVGQAQFGYRFSLDFAPILWLMLGLVFTNGMSVAARVAVALGVAVNLYGIWAIDALHFVAWPP
ncbi:MAG: hypothetical protein ABIP53_00785 [Candidatus Limnocylindrales bacterium]